MSGSNDPSDNQQQFNHLLAATQAGSAANKARAGGASAAAATTSAAGGTQILGGTNRAGVRNDAPTKGGGLEGDGFARLQEELLKMRIQ